MRCKDEIMLSLYCYEKATLIRKNKIIAAKKAYRSMLPSNTYCRIHYFAKISEWRTFGTFLNMPVSNKGNKVTKEIFPLSEAHTVI